MLIKAMLQCDFFTCDISESLNNEPMIYIPYVSYVKGSAGVFVPESQAPTNIYLLGEIERVYTLGNVLDSVE